MKGLDKDYNEMKVMKYPQSQRPPETPKQIFSDK